MGKIPSSANPRSASMLTMRSFSARGCGIVAIRDSFVRLDGTSVKTGVLAIFVAYC
jgi:hypothetical protein